MRHLAAFKAYYDQQFKIMHREHFSNHKRLLELHPSSYPFCALRQWYEWGMSGELPSYRELDTSGLYYTSVGTTFHSVIQDALGKGGKMLGDWTCLNPNCKHTTQLSHKHKCPKCKQPMRYEELSVRYGNHIVGHCDGLFKWGDGYIVIDYKTSSVRNIWKHRKEGLFPYSYNVSQIESYCHILEKQYGIIVYGWLLIYCSRDSPSFVKEPVGRMLTAKDKLRIAATMEQYDRDYGIILRATKLSDLKVVVEEKVCKVRSDLKAMESDYSKCPLGKVCFNRVKLKEALLEAKANGVNLFPMIEAIEEYNKG